MRKHERMASRVQFDDVSGAQRAAPRRLATPKPQAGVGAKTDRTTPALTGIFAPASSSQNVAARMFMDLFVDERTGRLLFDAPSIGRATLFFLSGEPVHASFTGAVDAVFKRLVAKGALPPSTNPFEKVPSSSSNPLASLAKKTHPVVVLEALRDEVRDLAKQLLGMTAGEWAFYNDEDFADATPLTAVNPFGFVLDAKRRSLAPDVLLRLGEEIALKYPEPKGGFANVSLRLRSFTGGVDLGAVIDGTVPALELYRMMGLDPIMGGLVLQTLADTGLVGLSDSKRAAAVVDKRRLHTNQMPALVAADSTKLSQLASLPGRGGAEILALYLELKPERSDEMILGVTTGASPIAVERGYQQRLAELDPRAISAGANRPYLLARAEELRAKVERAYRALSPTTSTRSPHGAYEVFERIGEGGMAEVFRGRATDDHSKQVAIKRILPKLRGDADFAKQFLDEARLARRIQHPNVVRIYTVGKSGDDLYLAMELVDGNDLGELIRRSHKLKKMVPVDVACRIIADASGGLHAAHTARDRTGAITPILHRDVSTQNILVSKTGDVKLTDFGIAKATGVHDDGEDHKVQGKVPYLSPELLDGHAASVRSDVYAMAMTLYAALGKLPFSRNDSFATMRAILNEPLPLASSLRPDVPPAIDAVLARAAARNPEERHASAQELQLELEEALTAFGTVDVGNWVRVITTANPEQSSREARLEHPTKTVPILEDIDLSKW